MDRPSRRRQALLVSRSPVSQHSDLWTMVPMRDPRPAQLLEGRFPDYDVLAKRLSPSWNDKTREVITHRLAVGGEPEIFCTAGTSLNGQSPCRSDRAATHVAAADTVPALVDEKLHQNKEDGYRRAGMPREAEAFARARTEGTRRRGEACLRGALPRVARARPRHFARANAPDDVLIKQELLELANICDKVADNIEDRMTAG